MAKEERHGGEGGDSTDFAQLSFREASEELEGIVRLLEGNQLELEESLACYERGVALLRTLQSRLAEAQQKVTVLLGEVEPEGDDSIDTTLS
ncbi:MAG: exodeoxyribonuclease VII small subunit [Coriobacteriales bacterium]|jgi:exodeoxyribonuclease VII small subunit|nr:exodeoxyribonuclease VII small subunit [Coriobacteriales bacterium]